jgi:hypothetical protein|tara:strand:- start:536 stop:1009 length:474 start_codon:yes stop_codon:yes gene_type:complete
MKLIFTILLCFSLKQVFSVDYISEFQANINIIKEFNISDKEKFRSYELIGTFTDEYGNYGKFDGLIISDIKDNKLIKLEGTAKTIYANNEVLYIKAFRKESDFDAGVANMEIIGASDKFKSLIGTKCKQSVRYFKDTIFGLQKCKITKEQSEVLKSN